MTLNFPATATAAYRAGKHDEALSIAERIVAGDPNAAEAYLTIALIKLRRGDIAAVTANLKACVALRSGEWLLERLRADFRVLGMPPLNREMAVKIGGFFRSSLRSLARALAPQHRKADVEFINVVGSSYVRSFGVSPALFPLFIGQGPTTHLMTDDAAVVTRRKFRENLKRVDSRRHVLLIEGSDPYYYVTQLRKAGEQRPNGATAADLAAMDAIADRHLPILTDAKDLIQGEVMLLAATPTFDDLMNELSLHLNRRLKAVSAGAGATFLDWWDELLDPATRRLRDDYCAHAYPGDVHLNRKATQRFLQLLQNTGHLSPDARRATDFEWTHVFECKVEESEPTRIWCEPAVTVQNTFRSHKIAAAHVGGIVADLMACLMIEPSGQTVLMVNVRDGYLPAALPPQLHSGCLAITDTLENLQVGRQVLDFWGRSDVRLELGDNLDMLNGQAFSKIVFLIHPVTEADDVARCNAVLKRIAKAPELIVGTPFPERLADIDLGGRQITKFGVANRHIPELWHNYTIAVAR